MCHDELCLVSCECHVMLVHSLTSDLVTGTDVMFVNHVSVVHQDLTSR